VAPDRPGAPGNPTPLQEEEEMQHVHATEQFAEVLYAEALEERVEFGDWKLGGGGKCVKDSTGKEYCQVEVKAEYTF
jgi:hypothetical protein